MGLGEARQSSCALSILGRGQRPAHSSRHTSPAPRATPTPRPAPRQSRVPRQFRASRLVRRAPPAPRLAPHQPASRATPTPRPGSSAPLTSCAALRQPRTSRHTSPRPAPHQPRTPAVPRLSPRAPRSAGSAPRAGQSRPARGHLAGCMIRLDAGHLDPVGVAFGPVSDPLSSSRPHDRTRGWPYLAAPAAVPAEVGNDPNCPCGGAAVEKRSHRGLLSSYSHLVEPRSGRKVAVAPDEWGTRVAPSEFGAVASSGHQTSDKVPACPTRSPTAQ